MKTKKAIVLPETLKIIIGVLCILVLIYLAWSLYSLFIKKTALEQAKETLKVISDKVKGLVEEGQTTDYLVTSPKDWVIRYLDDCGNKEKCIFACPKEYQSSPKTCLEKSVKEIINIKLNIGTYCAPGLEGPYQPRYTGCFEIGIKSIKFLRSGDYVFIGDEEYFSAVSALENALNYKDSETGKTVNQLIEDYVKSPNTVLKKKIESDITTYFTTNNFNTLSVWGITLTHNEEIIKFGYELKSGKIGSSGRDIEYIQEYWKSTIRITRQYNGKEYVLNFNYGLN